MSATHESPRPLPARPSLEFERKRAKKLLRELREGAPDTKLADAQFRIAREYGFASWPKLAEYFEAAERQDRSRTHNESYGGDYYEQSATSMLRRLQAGYVHAMPMVSAFVPRFYGMAPGKIPATELTIDDARLIVAREAHCPSWESLIERASLMSADRSDGWNRFDTPFSHANRALRSGDFEAAGRIVDQHPDLLKERERDSPLRGSLLASAVAHEWSHPGPDARRITEWVAARGASLRDVLGRMLIDAHRFDIPQRALDGTRVKETRTLVDYITFLLDRGADPTWLPANGVPILEHALVRYRSGKAVDLIATRVQPRQAFWIAAGLGDVAAVARYVNRDGTLRDAARRNRPDFHATAFFGGRWWTQLPDPHDRDIILEAFFVAATNQRWAVMDLLLDRGFPIDYSPFGASIVACFLQPPSAETFEYFVRRGVNLDITLGDTRQSLRDWSRQVVVHWPDDPAALRILELTGGGTPAELMQAMEAELGPKKPSVVGEHLAPTFALARDDARRMGRSVVEPDNIFVALLRGEHRLPLMFLGDGQKGADLLRLRAQLGDRLAEPSATPEAEIPFSDAARAIIEVATAMATDKRMPQVTVMHILKALVQADTGPVAELLQVAGGSPAYVRGALKDAI